MSTPKTEDVPAPKEATTETPPAAADDTKAAETTSTADVKDTTNPDPPIANEQQLLPDGKAPPAKVRAYVADPNNPLTVTQEITRRARRFAKRDEKSSGNTMHVRAVPKLMSHLGCLFNKPELRELLQSVPDGKFVHRRKFVKTKAICQLLAQRIKVRMYEPPHVSEIRRLLKKLPELVGGFLMDPEDFRAWLGEMPTLNPDQEDMDVFKWRLADKNGQVHLCCLIKNILDHHRASEFSIYKYMDEIKAKVKKIENEDDLSVDRTGEKDEFETEEEESDSSEDMEKMKEWDYYFHNSNLRKHKNKNAVEENVGGEEENGGGKNGEEGGEEENEREGGKEEEEAGEKEGGEEKSSSQISMVEIVEEGFSNHEKMPGEREESSNPKDISKITGKIIGGISPEKMPLIAKKFGVSPERIAKIVDKIQENGIVAYKFSDVLLRDDSRKDGEKERKKKRTRRGKIIQNV